jgi:hypothetical protein
MLVGVHRHVVIRVDKSYLVKGNRYSFARRHRSFSNDGPMLCPSEESLKSNQYVTSGQRYDDHTRSLISPNRESLELRLTA